MERKASARSELERMLVDDTATEPKALPLSLLEDITGNFADDQEIGRGGFALVYKGKLGDRAVAVKRLCDAFWTKRNFTERLNACYGGYMAPELLNGGVITRSADLYSLGVIIIEILTGKKGYQDIEDVQKSWSDRLERSQRDTLCEQIRVCYETALECIYFNPEKRPASAGSIIDRLHEMGSIQAQESLDGSLFECCGANCQRQCSSSGGEPTPLGPCDQGVASIVSRDLFEQLLPHRNDVACPAHGFYTYDAFIIAAAAFPSFGTTGSMETRKQEVAAFFAQTSHETSGGWPTAPDGPFSWGYCYKEESNKTMSYCDPQSEWPCAPDKKYYGRGPIQLSWNYNYGPAGRAIGVDLLNNPDLVATDPVVSFKTALWFWMTTHANKPSCHAVMTGQWTPTAADIEAGRLPGYGVVTNIINGGIESGKGPDPRVASRIGFYKHYCDILDVGNLNCYNQCLKFNSASFKF